MIDHENEDMRDIDCQARLRMRALGDDEAALAHGAAVDEGRRVAGDEDEDLGRVGEAVIADRDPVDDVRRNMVEEDQPKREAAKQVQPQVASGVATMEAAMSRRSVRS